MFRNIAYSSWCIDLSDKLFYFYYSCSDWFIFTYKSFEVNMDIVYEQFLNTFHQENQATKTEIRKFYDFFSVSEKLKLENSFAGINVSVVSLKNGKYFISNEKSKGFFLDRNSDIEKVQDITSEYKELQKSFGKITDLFGFTNRYFENIVELFSNDRESIGLGDFTEEFLSRTDNETVLGSININKLFTIAYEANGNRIVLDNDNHIYIYAHDLMTHHYQIIRGIPKNTFYKIPNINTLSEFLIAFLEDFFSS